MNVDRGGALGIVLVVALCLANCSSQSGATAGGCDPGQKMCPDTNGTMHCVGLDQPQFGCAESGCGPCQLENAVTRCDSSNKCAVAICNMGFAHCSADPSQGCEISISTDVHHCGQNPGNACGNDCDAALLGAPFVTTTACIFGACEVGDCMPGHLDCDKLTSNGCECAAPAACTPTGGCS
jgi:hypothetical protein